MQGLSRTDERARPDLIGACAFGARLQAAVVTLTARHRVSRRGISELARDLFGLSIATGSVDAICQRASDALAGPHCQLQDWVLDQGAVHVDETGWRTKGEGRALWTATTPEATFLQIAEHCNREQFDALIGTRYPGIVVSDRWNGFSHLDPTQRQVCWSHLQRDFRRHADGLAEQKPSANTAWSSPTACSKRGGPTSTSTTTARRSKPRSHRSRPNYGSCSRTPARRAGAPAGREGGTGGSRTTFSRSGPRSGLSPPPLESSRPTTPRSARSAHRSSAEKSRLAPKAMTASDSPSARSRLPRPAACNAVRCSPTSAN
jgi:Transposase IS66 family